VEREGWETWLHKHLCRSAASVTGLDYNADAVAALNTKGYNIICADAMTVDLGRQYDVITMGEIIEHVENPGSMLRNMRRHLNPGGQLIVTTPNAFFALHFVESLVANPYKRWNDEHVQWFDYFTLGNMFQRCGLNVEECLYFARSRKTRKVLGTLGLKCPRYLASTLMMIGSSSDTAPA
jgi:SAM-dependent methyltransferase